MKSTLNRAVFAFLSAVLFMGCGGSGDMPDAESGSLIRQSDWVVDTGDNNVFGAAPIGIECIDEIDYRVESLGAIVFAISTANLCDFLTVSQATRLNIRAGDLVQLRAFHFTLTGPIDSVATMAVAFGDTMIWEKQIDIPTESSDLGIEFVWTADKDYPAGTTIYFHVDNHGDNEYGITSVFVNPISLQMDAGN